MMLSQLKSIQNNGGYTLCAGKDGFLYVSHVRGIAPIMKQLEKDSRYFSDCIIVDRVIGKAAAMLYHRSRVAYIHARLMSEAAYNYLSAHHIPFSYEALCPYIINRTQTGMCPMEECVKDTEDNESAYIALKEKLSSLRSKALEKEGNTYE